MMTDIFSSFDPYTSFLPTNISPIMFWLISFITLTIIHSSLWMQSCRYTSILYLPTNTMFKQSNRTSLPNLKGSPSLLVSLFFMLIMINFMGLLPYVFSMSSHLLFTMTFGLPLWLSMILSAAIFYPKKFTAHFLPSGAPDWLNPFLIIIETLSTLARPITLSFRLAANMSAGHIVLGLIGIYATSSLFSSITNSIILLSIQSLYLIFEIGICMIQAYIFCLLLSLYSDDHPNL
uniref:ATP synthase subunit a n=1 Tax=Laetmonice producta TaxID=2153329 RepID=A0A343W6E8_9ANNE|nr:ATP synthase F0 subunit 6 [Laetmonice producta]